MWGAVAAVALASVAATWATVKYTIRTEIQAMMDKAFFDHNRDDDAHPKLRRELEVRLARIEAKSNGE
jgi:hypothetical protein